MFNLFIQGLLTEQVKRRFDQIQRRYCIEMLHHPGTLLIANKD
jgi:hypothetical protein